MKLDLISNNGETLTIDVPTHWEHVSLGMFISLQGKTAKEQHALLCGLTMEQYEAIAPELMELINVALEFIQSDPILQPTQDYPKYLGAESIGKMELAKKAMQDTADKGHLEPLPYLYAIYLMPERYDVVQSLLVGFPESLSNEVRAMPMVEVLEPCLLFMQQVSEITIKYGQAIHREPEPEMLSAGFDRLDKFGFFALLVSLSPSDPVKRAQILNMKADEFYMERVYEAQLNDCNKELQQIMKTKQTA